uniref:Secreted protein n=1 Tax=Knipowitschia caucasica TaxID=637954 RepID=A0AAV2JX94_KNICA
MRPLVIFALQLCLCAGYEGWVELMGWGLSSLGGRRWGLGVFCRVYGEMVYGGIDGGVGWGGLGVSGRMYGGIWGLFVEVG